MGVACGVKKRIKLFCLYYVLVWLTILFTSVCHAQATADLKVLTLKEAIKIALKNQPTIEALNGQVLAGEAKTGQAKGNYYPHLALGGAYTRIWPVGAETSFSTSLAGAPPGSTIPTATTQEASAYSQYAATANISQLIFDFGKTKAVVAAQKAVTEAYRLDLQNLHEQVVFNVKQAYYTVLSTQRARDVASEAVDQFKKHLEYAKALFHGGTKPKLDVTKAEVELSNSQVELIKAENAVRLALATLNNAIGMPDSPPYMIEDLIPSAMNGQSFEEAIKVALDRRPDLLAIKKQKESIRESIKAARLGHLPTINGSASMIYVGTDETPLDNGWTAGVNIVFPLFTGFVTSYQVVEAQANYNIVTANERKLRQDIFLELQQGFLTLREAAERIRSTEISIRQATENLDLANERYAAGLAIGLDVMYAVVTLAKTRMDNISATYDHAIAQASIEKAMGGESN